MLEPLRNFYRSTAGQALCSAALLWAALPPLDLWPLAWIAPVWWILLARRAELPGRRPYLALWAVGFLFWLAAFHFVRLPHPATTIGWFALAAYLGCYLPIFVALVRVAVHRLRVSVVLAAPVVWTGLELARAHLITGITLGALGHTQFRWTALIQVSDLAGGYAVCFVVMFVAAGIARIVPCGPRRWSFWPVLPAAALVAGVLLYGHLRTAAPNRSASPTLRVALIQGSITPEFKYDPDRLTENQEQYEALSREALDRWEDLDLIIWPETMFPKPLVECDLSAPPPPEWTGTAEQYRDQLTKTLREQRAPMFDMVGRFGVPTLLGILRVHFTPDSHEGYNSAVLVAPDGRILGQYDKMHRVLCGEYIPLAEHFPSLERLSPIEPIGAGTAPAAFELKGIRLAPSICYETVLPHLIRRQVVELRDEGREPDVLVNLTNDGWFRGSSELDMHLVCAVFRAVECRKPVLIAANTGFSAWIDADGRIRQRGPRHDEGVLLATVGPDRRRSWYLVIGDIPAGICLLACVALATTGLWRRFRRSRPATP